jgi:uncharacterized membrane protein YphA (DoxX/SURF4 family)
LWFGWIASLALAMTEVSGAATMALNCASRFFAIVLILFVILATFYHHDFWNQTGAEARNK